MFFSYGGNTAIRSMDVIQSLVIDSIMGSGKTTYIIDQLKKEEDRSKRFLIVTPYLKETDRLIGAVPN
jgi:thymidine kinase